MGSRSLPSRCRSWLPVTDFSLPCFETDLAFTSGTWQRICPRLSCVIEGILINSCMLPLCLLPLPDDRWTKLPVVGNGGGQPTAASRCMALPQLQTMESACTFWHTAAGVSMCLFLNAVHVLLLVTFSFSKSDSPMAVCYKGDYRERVYQRKCTWSRDGDGFYFSSLK